MCNVAFLRVQSNLFGLPLGFADFSSMEQTPESFFSADGMAALCSGECNNIYKLQLC